MSWFQRNGSSSSSSKAANDITDPKFGGSISDLFCLTEEVESTTCETKQVKGGKFARKCEISKESGLHCLGKPYRVVQTSTVYTEDELTSLPEQNEEKPLTLSVFGIDVSAIQRQTKSLLGAAEEMKSSICKRGSAERK